MNLDGQDLQNLIHSTLENVRKKFLTLHFGEEKESLRVLKMYRFLEQYENRKFHNLHLETCMKKKANYEGDEVDSCICEMLMANIKFINDILNK